MIGGLRLVRLGDFGDGDFRILVIDIQGLVIWCRVIYCGILVMIEVFGDFGDWFLRFGDFGGG